MVGKYKRKGNRLQWEEENMQAAIEAIQSKKMGWYLASKTFSVPFGTLRRRCLGLNKISKGSTKSYMGGKRTTFEPELERDLVDHIKNMETRLYGLTTKDVRKLAYDLAVQNNLKHNFNDEKGMAGWDWLKGFTKRNPDISLRIPESTSAARARAFNRPQIQNYFKLLLVALNEVNFDPGKIWNMDESGFTTVPSDNAKIFATKGRKQVGILSSAERGKRFTAVCAMSASGNYVPPCFIFPRKNMKKELTDNCPPGSVGFAQEKGWMTSEIFLKWIKLFVKFVKPSTNDKVLLLLDGHSSHKSLEAQIYAKNNGVILFCFPPHTTHRVQPLDICFFGPLTTYYNQELLNWLRNHPGRVVTHFQVGEIFKAAYQKAATMSNAEKGFAKAGIFPYNENIFPDWMFEAAETTNQELEVIEEEKEDSRAPDQTDEHQEMPGQSGIQNITASTLHLSEGCEEVNGRDNTIQEAKSPTIIILQDVTVKPQDLSPLPKAAKRNLQEKKPRKTGKIGILNTTPEIDELKMKSREKVSKTLGAQAKKKFEFAESIGSTSKIIKKSCRNAGELAKKKLKNMESEEDCNDDDDDDVACIFCNGLFSHSKAKEKWIRCNDCKKWAHCACADVGPGVKKYTCELCL